MGYCIQMRDSNFVIEASNFAPALAAIKGLAGKETINDSSGRHFSWVNTNDFVNAKTLEEAMLAWRWEIDCGDDGSVQYIYFTGEKIGDDMILFDAIAPFVEDGSYIEMQGEDGAIWRWVFADKKVQEKYASISWE